MQYMGLWNLQGFGKRHTFEWKGRVYDCPTHEQMMELERIWDDAQSSDLGAGVGNHGMVYATLERMFGITISNWIDATVLMGRIISGPINP
jgi:hypothetical protein